MREKFLRAHMNIHLSKPGGQMEGPFTVDEINRDIAAKRYQDNDYWAWYEGLSEWVPLHSVPGVTGKSAPREVAPVMTEETQVISWSQPGAESKATELDRLKPGLHAPDRLKPELQASDRLKPGLPASEQPTAGPHASDRLKPGLQASEQPKAGLLTESPVEKAPPSLQEQLSSGLPFAALERIVVLTTGEGPSASQALATTGMLEAVTGERLETIRQQVARDVITNCGFLEKLRSGGPIPDVAWRAVADVNPDLVKQAREGVFRICARTFPIDSGDVVALFLFYNKQKL